MTENIKRLHELASNDEALKAKLNSASKDELISLAKEHGIDLTDEDFALSDDELSGVTGGKKHRVVIK